MAARAFIAERGYRPTEDDIRRCRQESAGDAAHGACQALGDFFSISECRDLLFHVQESRMTIPQISTSSPRTGCSSSASSSRRQFLQHYRDLFAANGWSMTDLDRWHAFETQCPDTFAGMYNLWVQKN